MSSLWKSITGRKTRKYNKLSDIDKDINDLDPDEISKQILKDPVLTPRRGRKLNVLLNIRDAAKKQGKTGLQLKNEVKSQARKQIEAKRQEDAAVEEMMSRIQDEIDMEKSAEIRSLLPRPPNSSIKSKKSMSRSATKGGKRRSSKKSRRNKRR